jgi:hypothetical protein
MIVASLQPAADSPIRWPAMELGREANSSSDGTGGGGDDDAVGCSLLRIALPSSSTDEKEGYPINALRNAGIHCVATTHYFVVDVDFWPSTELRELLTQQLRDWPAQLALVVPAFQRSGHGCRTDYAEACRDEWELGKIEMPTDFESLQACLSAKDCVGFDSEFNPAGQSSTDVKAWASLGRAARRAVPCILSDRYEPYVVLERTAATPTFDERFRGYGKNKMEHLVHLRHAGYAFEVLGTSFVLHFPHARSEAKQHWLRSSAHGKIDRLFASFSTELKVRYAAVRQRTPLCSQAQRQK